jgi:tetratricopeptide (TPR) repeat protein
MQPNIMTKNSLINNESLLEELGISPKNLAKDFSAEDLDYYIGIVNLLTKYKLNPGSSALEKIKPYREALHFLCQLQSWEKIQVVLRKKFPINSNTLLPLYEYLIFNELSRELLTIAQEILASLNDCEHDLTFAKLLKARAVSGTSTQLKEARFLLEELFNTSLSGTEIHVESLAYLGIRQVNSGLYHEGIENLHSALIKADVGELALTTKIKELKTDILENLAFCEMNASHFQEAIKLYGDVITLREELGLLYKIIGPLSHQGIISRKIGNYDEAQFLLEKAKSQATEFGSESQVVWISHHLAYVFLNQGNSDLSEELCKFSTDGYQKFDNQWGLSDCYEQMGLICLAQKKYAEAEEYFRWSLNIRIMIGNRHGTASSTLDLALAFWNRHNFPKAVFYMLKGFYLYYKLGILNLTRLRRMLKLALGWTLQNKKWTM